MTAGAQRYLLAGEGVVTRSTSRLALGTYTFSAVLPPAGAPGNFDEGLGFGVPNITFEFVQGATRYTELGDVLVFTAAELGGFSFTGGTRLDVGSEQMFTGVRPFREWRVGEYVGVPLPGPSQGNLVTRFSLWELDAEGNLIMPPVTAVPEPGTVWLVAARVGVLVVIGRGRRVRG